MLRVITLTAILSIALGAIALRRAVPLEQTGSKSDKQGFGEPSSRAVTSATIASNPTGQNCYMQTPDGKITYFDFCGDKLIPPENTIQNNISPVVEPAKPAGRAVLFVSDLKYEGDWLIGRVTNAGDRQADRVRIYWEVLDRFGEVIGADYSCASPPIIQPGQTVTFRDFVYPDGFTVRTTAIAWGPDGATVASLFPALRSRTIYYGKHSLVQVFKTNQLKFTQCSLYSY